MTGPDTSGSARRFRDRWIDAILAHHRSVLLLALVVTGVAVWLAARLEIDSDLRALLPDDHPVVTNLDRIEETFGALGSVNVVVKGGTVEVRHAFADAVAADLEGHPMLDEVEYRLQSGFFIDHALYYLSDAEFEELRERVDAWQHFETCSAAPTLCTTTPDPAARDRLRDLIEAKREAAWARTGFRDYFERPGIDALVVLLHPTRPSSDLVFAIDVSREMSDRLAAVAAREGPWQGTGLTYNLVGPYVQMAAEREIIGRDMVRGALVGLGGVLVVLYLLFRSFRAVFVLLVPLLCGVVWSLAATELMLGHLNTMTSLISSVVMGMGIDAGIHFYTRARRERDRHGEADAIRRAFGGLVVPLLVASGTTVGALAIMATSSFLAFKEFGIIAASGVALCMLAMVTVFPALLQLVGIKRARRPSDPSVIGLPTRWLLARPTALFVVLVAVTVASASGVDRVRKHGFENNGRLLQSDAMRERTEADVFLIGDVFGKDIHAGTITIPTYAEVERVFAMASERHATRVKMGDSLVADLFAAPELMPPAGSDQVARRAQIDALTEDFTDRTWAKLEGRDPDAEPDEFDEFDPVGESDEPAAPPAPPAPPDGVGGGESLAPEDAAQLRRMLEAQPFGVDDLPPNVLARVRAEDGSYGIFAYPAFDPADMFKGLGFLEETASYAGADERVYVGETTVYAAMYRMMEDEWPVILGMAALLIAGLVFWQMRTIGDTLLTLLPLAVGLWWMIGLMGVLGIKFTLFNVPILPAVLGAGVDNGVYLTAEIRGRRGQRGGLARSVDETGRAILAATATTGVGFAAFMVADSGGLRSIGVVAVLGISMVMFAAVLVLPAVAALGERRRGIPILEDDNGGSDQPRVE